MRDSTSENPYGKPLTESVENTVCLPQAIHDDDILQDSIIPDTVF